MMVARLLLLARLRGARHAARGDARARVTWAITLLFGLVTGLASARWLAGRADSWQAAGDGALGARLWLLLLGSWLAIGALSVLALLQRGLADDESVLLLTLPLPPADRFRALFATMVIAELGGRIAPFAAILAVAVGRIAAAWIWSGIAGAGVAAVIGIVGTLLAIRLGVAQSAGSRCAIVLASAALVGLLAALVYGYLPHWRGDPPSPTIVGALLAAVLIVALGPGATPLGALYVAACQRLEGRAGDRTVRLAPGVAQLAALLRRRRGATGALLVRELLGHSRNPFTNLVRIIVLAAALPLFLWLRQHVGRFALSDQQLLVGYVASLCVYTAIDTTPSPIGSEGDRLTHFLVAPLGPASLLRAKLVASGAPLVIEGGLLCAVLGRWIGMPPAATVSALATVILILIATTALLTWGSAWDEDVALPVQGTVATLLQEQAPITPRRVALLNLCVGILVVALLLVWRLPTSGALLTLTLLATAVAALSWGFGLRCVRRLSA